MRLSNHVAEFEGPGQLAEAGQTLLANPDLDMVVVRGLSLGFQPILSSRNTDPKRWDQCDKAYEILPELTELDAAVQEWWDQKEIGSSIALRPKVAASPNMLNTAFHTDSEISGPLTISLRTDGSCYDRRFYAKRPNECILDGDKLNFTKSRALERKAKSLNRSIFKLGASSVRQARGDGIMFTNSPYPTIHAVDTPQFKTETMLLSYRLDIDTHAYI